MQRGDAEVFRHYKKEINIGNDGIMYMYKSCIRLVLLSIVALDRIAVISIEQSSKRHTMCAFCVLWACFEPIESQEHKADKLIAIIRKCCYICLYLHKGTPPCKFLDFSYMKHLPSVSYEHDPVYFSPPGYRDSLMLRSPL